MVSQVGVPELVVFLNKVDLLAKGDEELQELVEMEVRQKGQRRIKLVLSAFFGGGSLHRSLPCLPFLGIACFVDQVWRNS